MALSNSPFFLYLINKGLVYKAYDVEDLYRFFHNLYKEEQKPVSIDPELLGENSAVRYLGMSLSEIKSIFDEPDETGTWGGSMYLLYKARGLRFHFLRLEDDEPVGYIHLHENSTLEVKGIKVGDAFPYIKDILGEPIEEGPGQDDGGYVMAWYTI